MSVGAAEIASALGAPVGPGDCAVAIAIPMTAERCEAQGADPRRDFAGSVAIRRFSGDGPDWRTRYNAFAGRIRSIIDETAAKCEGGSPGITVVWDATLKDIACLLRRFRVVTIVAHSPFRNLDDGQILDMGELFARFTAPADDPAEHAAVTALRRDPEIRQARNAMALLKKLRRVIDESQRFFHADFQIKPGGGHPSGVLTAHEPAQGPSGYSARPTVLSLYEAFPRAIRPPVVLELDDGVVDFESLVAAIPEDFTGTVEFLACSGMWFTQALRRRRPGGEVYLGPRQLAWFIERLTLYQNTIRLLQVSPRRYRDAVFAIHHAASEWLQGG